MHDISSLITYTGGSAAVRFAADELCRYLSLMTGRMFRVDAQSSEGEIVLGTYSDLPITDPLEVEDPAYDDSIFVEIRDGRGMISGSNPRSVLLAVYRYLTDAGCRWVRPGADGEYIPGIDALPDASPSSKDGSRSSPATASILITT